MSPTRTLKLGAAFGAFCALAGTVSAQGALPEALRNAMANGPKLRYSGTRIVEFKVGSEVTRHVEFVRRDGERTRIEFPPDSEFAGQVIVEDGNRRRHFMPDTNEILTLPARREEAFERLRGMLQLVRQGQLKVEASPGGPVAGFRTQSVALSDPNGNVVQRLWIDPRSGMILKREIFDRVGTRLGFFEFTTVQLEPIFRPNEFDLSRRGAREVTPEMQMRRLAKQSGLPAATLPADAGFQLESARLLRLGGEPVLAQTYLGRTARLSLFIVRNRVDERRIRTLAGQDFNVQIWTANNVTYALVGSVPKPQLAAIARSMNR
ncbi:MAG: hypothetical protein M9921_01385 [Fimbriimonadaceae bacterium]|nr:hypothetical protein [Fimbriimonadaceae bacterium]